MWPFPQRRSNRPSPFFGLQPSPFFGSAAANESSTPARQPSSRTNFASTSFGSASSSSSSTGLFRTHRCPAATTYSSKTSSETSSRSPGPPSSSSTTSSRSVMEPLEKNTMLAIVEGRGQARGEIGIALINMQTPTLTLCQFTDSQSYLRAISKVNVFRPHEILMPATACDPSNPSQLCVQIKKEVPNVGVIPLQRRVFNEAKGLQRLNSLVADRYAPVVHSITNKYYCLAAAAALLKYAELVQSVIFPSKTLKIDFQGCDETCMIDYVTAQHLELLQNNSNPTSSHCLLGILNDCRTPVGSRLLRMNILQPTCDEKLILTRLDSVEELINNRDLLFGLHELLGRLPVDIEHVIANLIQIPKVDHPRITENKINNIIALKQILEIIPCVVSLMEDSQNEYFSAVREDLKLPEYDAMLETIKSKIHDEAHYQKGAINMKRQRCFAVKADVNPILDIARKAYCEIIDEMNEYVINLSQSMNMSLRLGTSNQRGFFVQFVIPGRRDEIPNLPPTCLQVKKRGCMVTFTTETLISSDHRAQAVLKEIENLSGIVISELLTSLRADIGILFKVSEMIANLDLLVSLANYALVTPRTVRPTIHPDVTAITMGRHPVLDAISSNGSETAVPNNVCLSNGANFMLITGPNMSGKTTYIKQVACLQVLAQIGSFVPAEAASFRIAKNILSRIGTGDSIEENASSFALEMTEMTYILQNACKESLIIIDEFGRATSVEEGAAMSWAMIEALLKTEAFVLFATHHLFLTKLESHYPNLLNYTLETEEWEDKDNPQARTSADASLPLGRLQYSHKVTRGVTEVEFYGLKLAMIPSFPGNVISNAFKIAKGIIERRKAHKKSTNPNAEIRGKKLKHLLREHLLLLADPNNRPSHPDTLLTYMEYLQMEFCSMLNIRRATSPSETLESESGTGQTEQTN